jgi:DNA-binding beta-propeller fold protein YncE
MRRYLYVGGGLLTLGLVLGVGQLLFERSAAAQGSKPQSPIFQVDPMWPKPLPNRWILGSTIGVSVDAQDHVWIIHRPATLQANEIRSSWKGAPPVLEFDQAGNLVSSWGGPGQGYEWPQSEHGIYIDYKDNVWIAGNGGRDSHILKFTKQGKFLLQIGHQGVKHDSNDTENLGSPANMTVDPQTNEVYVADGYGNHRVIVFDADTGKYKRHWGAYGKRPDDVNLGPYNPSAPPPQQFRNPVHCAELSVDNMLYVCDRVNDRVQVFKPDGTFIKEMFYNKETLGSGSVWDIAFSKDPQQKYIYLADGENDKVHIIDRQSLDLLTSFGDGGRQPGEFYGVHSIAVDSKGNIYTTETYRGQRVQRFMYKGLAAVTTKNQGPAWPKK